MLLRGVTGLVLRSADQSLGVATVGEDALGEMEGAERGRAAKSGAHIAQITLRVFGTAG